MEGIIARLISKLLDLLVLEAFFNNVIGVYILLILTATVYACMIYLNFQKVVRKCWFLYMIVSATLILNIVFDLVPLIHVMKPETYVPQSLRTRIAVP